MANRDLTPWRDPGNIGAVLAPLTSFRRDRLFDNFGMPGDTGLLGNRDLQPDIEVQETGTAYSVTAELPGIDQKDLQVDVRDNVLSIAGEKHAAHQKNEAGRRYSERSYGRFERRIALGDEIDADKIEAKFGNGVLSITLPKNPRATDRGRHIEIKTQ
jgi:HSP20 family protein